MKRSLPKESRQQKNVYGTVSVVHCYIDEDLACFGIFVGMLLENKRRNANELASIRDSLEFHREVTAEVEKFVSRCEFTIENIEDHFKRLIYFMCAMFIISLDLLVW